MIADYEQRGEKEILGNMDQDILLYEGQEPYIFVSYCHKDREKVIPVIRRMMEDGYRIWFDRGIHPGSEWPEIVAEHLENCRVFMIFISDHYMQSQNCIREIHFAVSRNKKLLSVMMDEVRLTPGVEMQLCVSQALRYDKYRDARAFFKDLYRAEILEVCKNRKSAPAEKDPEVRTTDQNQKKIAKNIRRRSRKRLRRSGMAALVVLAAIIVVIGAAAGWRNYHSVEISGQKYTRRDTSVQVKEEAVTADLMNDLKELPALTSLRFENCSFEQSGLEGLKDLDTVTSLSLTSCGGVTDCEFLNGMSGLYTLSITGCDLTDEMLYSVEGSETLYYLTLSDSPQLTETEWVNRFPELRELNLDDDGIRSVENIAGLEELRTLSLKNNQITEVSGTFQALRLESVDLSGNRITDLSGLDNLTVLTGFYMGDNGYAGENEPGPGEGNRIPACVNASCETLRSVDLSGNGFSREEMNAMLGNCSQLTYLDVSDNPDLGSLDILASGDLLETLYAKNCGLTSLEGMENFRSLKEIDLSENVLNSLAGFPELDPETEIFLELDSNQLTGLEGLDPAVSYRALLLYDNPFDGGNLGHELGKMQGTVLGLSYTEGLDPETIKNFGNCYVEMVPDNQKVLWEDTLGYQYRDEKYAQE